MLKLYRGIVDILTERSEGLTLAFRNHIREFNSGNSEEKEAATGFWNLLLEITYILYVKSFVVVGLFITTILALVFFPLNILYKAFGMSFQAMKYEHQHPQNFVEPQLTQSEEKTNGSLVSKT
jgi:hypothetical protein